MIVNLLLKLENLVQKHLNEYVKWVLVLGLYIFYRMLEKLFDEKQLVILVIPILFISICIFLSHWIISALVDFFRIQSNNIDWGSGRKARALLTGSFFLLSLLSLIVFHFYEQVSLLNLGFFTLLASGLIPFLFKGKKAEWTYWPAWILLLLGMVGFIMSILRDNALNTISFVFYVAFLLFYFLNKLIVKKQQ